jgi:hypothetical protein
MENPFKEILHQEELPKMLRKKVMNDISFIKLAIDMTDLLMVQYPGTIDNLLRLNKKK